MNNFNSIKLQEMIADSVSSLFAGMMAMQLDQPQQSQSIAPSSFNLVAWVSFQGEAIDGMVEIGVTETFGSIMTSRMLGKNNDDMNTDQEIREVLQEASNIIGGAIKSKLCDLGLVCKMSPPLVVDSMKYQPGISSWSFAEGCLFKYEGHTFFVRGFIK